MAITFSIPGFDSVAGFDLLFPLFYNNQNHNADGTDRTGNDQHKKNGEILLWGRHRRFRRGLGGVGRRRGRRFRLRWYIGNPLPVGSKNHLGSRLGLYIRVLVCAVIAEDYIHTLAVQLRRKHKAIDAVFPLSHGNSRPRCVFRYAGSPQIHIGRCPVGVQTDIQIYLGVFCLGGFDAYCMSTVLPGSGLSSSAAYEVLIGTIINSLFFEGKMSPPEIAMIGQYAENVFFGKPCGLMDQTASAVGGLVTIDFATKDNPDIRSVDFDFSGCGHALCIVDSGADHANLTDEYAAVPGELKNISAHFGKEVITEITEEDFYAAIPQLRQKCGDRAVLRGVHEYQENQRVSAQVAALEQGDFKEFLKLVKESGYSSWMYLQNVIPAGYKEHQDMAVALALCEKYLAGQGAFRVHGGGFAGTVQAFVPFELLDSFKNGIEAALGAGACHVLSIRPQGGVEMDVAP